MTKIIVDHREDKEIIRELTKQGLDIEIKQLAVADFIIQTKDNEGNIKDLAVERKSQMDFINSIIDKRLVTQLINLKEYYPLQLLIIEGSRNIFAIRNFHPNAIRGMLASIAIDFQVPVIYTKNFRDTASFLNIIAKRLEKQRKNFSLVKKVKPLTLKEQQEFLIESLPGIGPSLSKELLKKFGSVKKIINASEEKLIKVPKIGKKKAEAIKKVLDEKYV
nr:hypothetical protein [Candidatus Woesearchaeota archaeon]